VWVTAMSELHLDYQKNAPFPWLGVCLLGVMAIVAITVAIYLANLQKQADVLQAKLDRVSVKNAARAAANPSRPVGKVDLAQEIKSANEVLHQLSVPWDELFKAVESSSGSHITLLALEPDFERKQVKIGGEANSYKTIMKYITELEKQEVFGAVYLQNHDIRQDDPDMPVRFSLLANWKDQR
jgi:hypothetical protein